MDLYRKVPGEPGEYEAWSKTFDVTKHDTEALLKDNTQLNNLYSSLVPGDMTPTEFWGRYFFRKETISAKEQHRQNLLQRTQIDI